MRLLCIRGIEIESRPRLDLSTNSVEEMWVNGGIFQLSALLNKVTRGLSTRKSTVKLRSCLDFEENIHKIDLMSQVKKFLEI